MVRVAGIEPASHAWEAHILPMNYTRRGGRHLGGGVYWVNLLCGEARCPIASLPRLAGCCCTNLPILHLQLPIGCPFGVPYSGSSSRCREGRWHAIQSSRRFCGVPVFGNDKEHFPGCTPARHRPRLRRRCPFACARHRWRRCPGRPDLLRLRIPPVQLCAQALSECLPSDEGAAAGIRLVRPELDGPAKGRSEQKLWTAEKGWQLREPIGAYPLALCRAISSLLCSGRPGSGGPEHGCNHDVQDEYRARNQRTGGRHCQPTQ